MTLSYDSCLGIVSLRMEYREEDAFQAGYGMESEEDAKRERQEQHYAMLSQIQDMARSLPL